MVSSGAEHVSGFPDFARVGVSALLPVISSRCLLFLQAFIVCFQVFRKVKRYIPVPADTHQDGQANGDLFTQLSLTVACAAPLPLSTVTSLIFIKSGFSKQFQPRDCGCSPCARFSQPSPSPGSCVFSTPAFILEPLLDLW